MLSRRRRANKCFDNGASLYFLIRLNEVRMFEFHCLFGYMWKRSKRIVLVCWLCFLGMVVEKVRIYRSLPKLSLLSRSYWNISIVEESGVSEKGSGLLDDAVGRDNSDTRMIRIYGLRDEDEWTHPTHNYTYPPW